MALVDVVEEALEPINETYAEAARQRLWSRLNDLRSKVEKRLVDQGIHVDDIRYEFYLNMRYQGTETPMMVLSPKNGDFKGEFLKNHLREFSFVFPETKPILVDDVRIRGIGKSGTVGADDEQLGSELESMKSMTANMDLRERTVCTRLTAADLPTLTDLLQTKCTSQQADGRALQCMCLEN